MKIALTVNQIRSLIVSLNALADNVEALPCNFQIPLDEGKQVILEFDDSQPGIWLLLRARKQS